MAQHRVPCDRCFCVCGNTWCLLRGVLRAAALVVSWMAWRGQGWVFALQSRHRVVTARGIRQYLALGLPCIFLNSFEWLILETVVILSGYVSPAQVALSSFSITS